MKYNEVMFFVSQNDEQRYYRTEKSPDEILAVANGDNSFAALSGLNKSERISESEYAEIQQSADFTYSVEVDLDSGNAEIYSVNDGKGGVPEGERNENNFAIKTVELSKTKEIESLIQQKSN